MADTDLKDFTTSWILAGFLLTCLIGFAITFMAANNTSGLGGDTDSIFDTTYDGTEESLQQLTTDSDTMLNITANTNPEVGQLGSRDSVAAGFVSGGIARSKFQTAKIMLGWVFSDAVGQMLIGIISGLIGIGVVFFVTKFIKGWN